MRTLLQGNYHVGMIFEKLLALKNPKPETLKTTSTWTPKVCKIMAFMAVISGLGPLFYILLGSRYHTVRLCLE